MSLKNELAAIQLHFLSGKREREERGRKRGNRKIEL